MLLNILKQINWVDILIVILVLRTCLVAAKSGFPVELFKFLGTLAAIFLSLHYFVILSANIGNLLSLDERLPVGFLQFIVFVLLAIAGYAAFILLRSIFYRFLKMEAVSSLNKWGSLALGITRGIFLSSLIIFAMVISSIKYLEDSARSSYSGKRIFMAAPGSYSWLWNNAISKFDVNEKFNNQVDSIIEEFNGGQEAQ